MKQAFRATLTAGLALAALAGAAHAQSPDPALAARATSARELEDLGAYGRAVDLLMDLRRRTAPDADLELAIAINEARIGRLDSAAVRLWSPLLEAASVDSLPLERRVPYFWGREGAWLNGRFDGWHWNVVRARAEVAAKLGRWDDALKAAEAAVAAQPLSGKEWHILATCQARTGLTREAIATALHAAMLDPTLPEPAYLAGVLAWRLQRKDLADRAFRDAIRRDSSWTAPAIALVRARLPVQPDTIPAEFFTGLRKVAERTSPDGPKLEHFRQVDRPATLLEKTEPVFPADLQLEGVPPPLTMSVFLDRSGRPVVTDLPWLSRAAVTEGWVSAVIGALPTWRYAPAMLHGEPQPVWVTVQYEQSSP